MVPRSMMFKAASTLTAVGIGLVLAGWYAKPDAWLAFTAVLAMFALMIAALRLSRRALQRSVGQAAPVRGPDRTPTAVVFAALMMGIPLALTLARSYGLVDDVDFGRRATGVLTGAFLAMLGNVMPKDLPPFASTRRDDARQQAFQRLAGWTWVLCGLASAISWLALSLDAAEVATVVVVVAALAVTIAQLLRFRLPRKDQAAGGLS